ncbi:MAG: amidohydrolase family protein [Sciscionella sp.]
MALSGAHRLAAGDTEAAAARLLRPRVEALCEQAPDRLIWGSDWPYVAPPGPIPTVADHRRVLDCWLPEELRQRNPGEQPGIALRVSRGAHRLTGGDRAGRCRSHQAPPHPSAPRRSRCSAHVRAGPGQALWRYRGRRPRETATAHHPTRRRAGESGPIPDSGKPDVGDRRARRAATGMRQPVHPRVMSGGSHHYG